MAITKDQIQEVITTLRATGKPFGPTHIRTELGEGSLSTISKYRQEVLDAEAKASEPPDPVTEEVVQIVRDLLHEHAEGPRVKELQGQLKDAAATSRELQKECERIEILLADAKAELAREQSAHSISVERHEARIQELSVELTNARGEVTRLQAAGQEHAQKMADMHKAMADSEKEHSGKVDQLHAEIRTLSTQLASIGEQLKSAQTVAAEAAAAKDKAMAGLATAEAAATAARKESAETVATVKKEAAEAIAASKADAAALTQQMRQEIADLKAELKAARDEAKAERSALDAARSEIADLRVQLAKGGGSQL